MKPRTEISMQLYQMMIDRGYPENLWDLSKKKEYGENVILYLQKHITEKEFRKKLSWM